eukprot:s225_g42.t1
MGSCTKQLTWILAMKALGTAMNNLVEKRNGQGANHLMAVSESLVGLVGTPHAIMFLELEGDQVQAAVGPQARQRIPEKETGRLPETADALAARFIAANTALSEGGWQIAAQLELYPLEQVQSATMATMLQAQKHRRMVQKSQGLYPTQWWPGAGEGTGAQQKPKGKKGEAGKGRGKGKGKGGKDQGWSQKARRGEQPLEGFKEGSAEEVKRSEGPAGPEVDRCMTERLAKAARLVGMSWSNRGVFKFLLSHCSSLEQAGRAMAWVMLNVPE